MRGIRYEILSDKGGAFCLARYKIAANSYRVIGRSGKVAIRIALIMPLPANCATYS